MGNLFLKSTSVFVSIFLFFVCTTTSFASENFAPTMNGDQTFVGNLNSSIKFRLAGASDKDHDQLTYSIINVPQSGELKGCLGGTSSLVCEFLPAQDFSGVVSFSYKANDGKENSVNTSVVKLRINNRSPQMKMNQTFTINEGEIFDFSLAGANDADENELTYSLVDKPANGILYGCANNDTNLNCKYVPEKNFFGEVVFSYKAHDGLIFSDSASVVRLNILKKQHRPIMIGNQSLSTEKNAGINFKLNGASVIHNDEITYKLEQGPTHGMLTGCLNAGRGLDCYFTPDHDFTGVVTFSYRAYNGDLAAEAVSYVHIVVGRQNTSPLIGADQQFEMEEDGKISFVINSASDADNDLLYYRLINSPSVGLLLNCLDVLGGLNCTYIPPKYFHGDVEFLYTVTDGINEALVPAKIKIKINHVNHAPTMNGGENFEGVSNKVIRFKLAGATDFDRDNLNYSLVESPSVGKLNNCLNNSSSLNCEYEPDPNFAGEVFFSYKANDGIVDSKNTSKVSLKIFQGNIPPVPQMNCILNHAQVSCDASLSYDADGFITQYSWDFGDGATADGVLVSHNYQDTGAFVVKLTVTDNFGKNSHVTQNVNVLANKLPVIEGLNCSSVARTMNCSIQNAYDPDGRIVKAFWKIDGQEMATSGVSISETYSQDGKHLISYNVIDDAGATASKETEIEVKNLIPIADYTCTNTNLTTVHCVSNSSDSDGSIVKEEWNWGDQTTSVGKDVTHTYLNAGSYGISLTVTDNFGGIGKKVASVISSHFTVSGLTGVAPVDVVFDASTTLSSSQNLLYQWNFGDGQILSSTTPIAQHTYTAAGAYLIMMSASDGLGGFSSYSDVIVVLANQAPHSEFSYNKGTGIVPVSVSFDASASSDDTAIALYEWDFGDGIKSSTTEPNIQHQYIKSGSYSVKLKITDNMGLYTISEQKIDLAPNLPPVIGLSANPRNGNPPLEIRFDASTTTSTSPIAKYKWNFGEGDEVETQTPFISHIYNTVGTFKVTLTVVDVLEAEVTKTLSIRVNSAPHAVIASDKESGPIPFSVTFDGSKSFDDSAIQSYLWDFGNGETQTTTTPKVTKQYSEVSDYTVSLKVIDDNGLESETATMTVIAYDPELPIAKFSTDVISGNPPLAVSFDANDTTKKELVNSYQWFFEEAEGGEYSSSSATATYVFNNPGKYDVQLSVWNAAGEPYSTYTKIIRVNAAPEAIISVSTEQGTNPLPIDFDATKSKDDDKIVSYSWDFGDGTVLENSTATLTHTYVDPGTYSITLRLRDSDGVESSSEKIITVLSNTAPTADFSYQVSRINPPQVITFNAEASVDDEKVLKYVWNFDGELVETVSPIIKKLFTTSGNKVVTLQVVDRQGLTSTVLSKEIYFNSPPKVVIESDLTMGNAPLPVSFDATKSTDNGQIVSYKWNFGDGGTEESAEETTDHVFQRPGLYTVVLTATDDEGMSSVHSLMINVAYPPKGSFVMNSVHKTAPMTVAFDGNNFNSTNGILSYEWDFGDGEQITTLVPYANHIYPSKGTYPASLTITESNGSRTTKSKNLIVPENIRPQALIKSSALTGKIPLVVNLSSLPSNDDEKVVKYVWEIDGAKIKEETSVSSWSYTFNQIGEHKVKLTVFDRQGLSDFQTVTVYAKEPNAPPVAVFSLDKTIGNPPFVVNIDASLSTDDNGVASYEWDFGDGTKSIERLPQTQHSFKNPGDYVIKLSVVDTDGVRTQTTKSIRVNAYPKASMISSASVGNPPFQITFNASGSTDDEVISEYRWDFGDGEQGTGVSASHNYAVGGVYKVRLTVVDNRGLTSEATTDVRINKTPEALFVADKTEGDFPFAVNFDASLSTDDTALSRYIWNFGDGTSIQEVATPKIAHTFTKSGAFNVQLKVIDANGLSTTIEKSISVKANPDPIASFDFSPAFAIAPIELKFNASGSTDDKKIVKYTWDFGDGKTQETTSVTTSHLYSTSGNYSVILKVLDNQGGVGTITKNVTINANQAPHVELAYQTGSVTSPLAVVFDARGSTDDEGIIKYRWNFGDGKTEDTSFAKNGHLYSAAGIYTAQLQVFDRQGLNNTTSVEVNVLGNPSADVNPPTVAFVPAEDKIIQKPTAIQMQLADASGVDFQKIKITLNGKLITKENYQVDQNSNLISLPINEATVLQDNKVNTLTVSLVDLVGNSVTRSKVYQVVPAPGDDTKGPQINFSPAGGVLATLTPTITISLLDQSEIDYASFEMTLNNVVVPSRLVKTIPEKKQIQVVFDGSFSLPNDYYSILRIKIKDVLGNQGTGAVGFGSNGGQTSIIVIDGNSEGGYTHTCALLASGDVKCWGDNAFGQLGYGNKTSIKNPASVGIVPLGEKAIQVVAGYYHTCALLVSGNVKCWGQNGYGQLGYGHTNDLAGTATSTPALLPYINIGAKVVSIAAGDYHNCALTEAKNVRCWGYNAYGRLGYGNTINVGDTATRTPASVGDVSIGGPVKEISLAVSHTCALLENETVKCWGSGSAGKLGYGNQVSIGDLKVPSDFGPVSVGDSVKHIYAGGLSTCALLNIGHVRCWGSNSWGNLGYGNLDHVGDNELPSAAGSISLGETAQKVVVGYHHTCALLTSGNVKCWGEGTYGQLGYGNTNMIGDNELPTAVGYVSIGGLAKDITAGLFHNCVVLTDGKLRCWGFNNGGQLGLGNTTTIGDNELPTSVGTVDLGAPLLQTASPFITASFLANPMYGYAPLTVSMDGTQSSSGAGAISTYHWDYGDGQSATFTTPTTQHTYLTEGVYLSRLTVTDDHNNQAFLEKAITVSQPNISPTTNFIIDKTFGAIPLAVNFNGAGSYDSNGNIVSFNWAFGDGQYETTTSAFTQHIYNTPGVYLASLTVTDNDGQSTTSLPQVVVVNVVNELPSADFNCQLAARTISCDGRSSSDSDGIILGYHWDFDDGDHAAGSIVEHTFSEDGLGSYDVKLEVVDNKGGKAEKIKTFKLDYDIPVIHIAQGSNLVTNNPSFQLDINVQDQSNVFGMIYHNNVFLTTFTDKSISIPVFLTEGINEYRVEVKDASGNDAIPVVLSNIVLDSVPATFANITPAEGSVQNALIFEVKGKASKELVGVMINGSPATLAADSKTFSGMINREAEGPYTITIEALDKGGNIATKTFSGEVFVPVFTKELITIVPDTTSTKIKVIGAPGAVRFPNHDVTVSAGFFNKTTIQSDDKGGFVAILDAAESLKLVSNNSNVGRDETINIPYIADTTLSGVVKDTDGRPLMGVTVTIASSGQRTLTNASGAFNIARPATGDQKLVIDGTTIPETLRTPERSDTADRSYSSVSIAINVGTNQRNILDTPIYLVPLRHETSTAVVVAQGGSVTSEDEAPGVEIKIPAGAAKFPDGSTTASVNMAVVTKDKTSVPTLDIAEPDTVVALEPSGTKFAKPVPLTLPNSNEFPAGTEMVILSKNSEKGIWEIDGEAVVTSGNEIKTKEGKGITHFSEVYAVPLGGKFAAIGDKDKPGADTMNGAMSTAISLPSYKALGEDHAPGLVYKSTWAHPSVIVSNLFDVPRDVYGDPKKWIEPDFITAKFYTESYVSPEMRYEGMPNRSVISYAMDLSNFTSGIHPYQSHYEIHLKEMTLRTRSIVKKVGLGARIVSQESYVETRKLEEVFPSDLTGPLYVQNKKNSEAGQGWRIGGHQQILNPENSKLLLEEADGNLSVYTLNNSMMTLYYDPNGVSAFGYNSFNDSLVINGSNNVLGIDFLSGKTSSLADLPSSGGKIGYNYPQGHRSCWRKCKWKVCFSICNTAWYCHEFESPYKNKRQPKQLVSMGNNKYIGIDYFGNLFSIENGAVQDLAVKTEAVPTYNSNSSICSKEQLSCSGFTNVNNYPAGNCSGPRPSVGGMYKLGFKDGTLGDAEFNNLMGITRAPQDNSIVVADTGNNRVRRVNLTTNSVETIAGNGGNQHSGDGQLAINANLFHPRGVAYDRAGNLYVTTENGYIRKIDPNGYISTFAGDPVAGLFTQEVVHAKKIRFYKPYGLAIDNDSNVMYVADTGYHRIIKIDMQTMMATWIAGSSTCNPGTDAASVGEGRPALEASLCSPEQLALDENKNLLIQDTGHKRIRRIATADNSQGKIAFAPGNKDNSMLYRNNDGTFERVYRNGAIAAFDKLGKQVSLKDRVGRVTTFKYENSKLASITDPTGSAVTYNYTDGKLASVVDPADRETRFTYAGNNLTKVEFPDGTSKSYAYNDKGLMISETDQKNISVTYSYNEWLRLYQVIKSNGEAITINDSASTSAGNNYTGGNAGKLKSYGKEEGQIYDGIKDARNIETKMIKDESGYVSSIVDGEGKTTSVTRDLEGRPVMIVRPDTSTATFVYDQKTGDLIKKTDTSTQVQYDYLYDTYGNLVSTKRNGQVLDVKTFDSNNGLLVSQENKLLNQKISYRYNALGLPIEITDPLGRKSQKEYDTFGNLARSITPEGQAVTYTRDAAGNVVKVVNPNEQVTVNSYDLFNRLLNVTTPKGEKTQYLYSVTGELEQITDPYNKKVAFEYDDQGRLAKKTDSVGRVTQLFYDGNDNIVKEIDPAGNIKTFSYDNLDRLVKKVLPDDVYELKYDIRGNVTQTKNTNSQIDFTYIHHDAGELVSSTTVDAQGHSGDHAVNTIKYEYNEWGLRKSMIDPLGGVTSYAFDQGNRLTGVKNHKGEIFSFVYDGANRLLKVARPGSTTDYNFDDRDFLRRIIHNKAGTTAAINYFIYVPDPAGNRTQMKNRYGNFDYSYDSNNQLVGATNPEAQDAFANEIFQYDAIGNRVQDNNGSTLYDPTKQKITEDYQYTYVHDSNGNLSNKISKTSDEVINFTHNSQNQLIKIETFRGVRKVKEVNYTYDALGRRIEKDVDDLENSGKSFVRRYTYDGNEILVERDENENVTTRYTHSTLRTDDVLAVDTNSKSYMYLKDGQGTITDVTDALGNLVQHYTYSAFGKILKIADAIGNDITANPILATPFTYTGREFDSESGLYYYRARYYDSSIGRFLEVDPHAGKLERPKTFNNQYTYVENSPTNLIDPSGAFGFKGAFKAVGAAMVAAAFFGPSAAGLAALYVVNTDKDFSSKDRSRINTLVIIAAAIGTGGAVGGAAAAGYSGLYAAAVGGFVGGVAGAFTGIGVNAVTNVMQGNDPLENADDAALIGGMSGAISGAIAGYGVGAVYDLTVDQLSSGALTSAKMRSVYYGYLGVKGAGLVACGKGQTWSMSAGGKCVDTKGGGILEYTF